MSRKSLWKRYQTTFVMLGLAVTLGGLALVEYQKAAREEVQEQKSGMMIGWEDVSDLASARLERGQDVIEVKKEEGVWNIVSPVKDLGDEFNIEAWITDIGSTKGTKIEAKKDSNGKPIWSEYGLDKNLRTVILRKNDGSEAILQFAEHNAFDGSFFVKYKDEVWVGEKPWVSVLNKSLKHLRSRDIFRHNKTPNQFSFDYPGKTDDFSISKKDEDQWQFLTSPNLEVSSDDVNEWLGALRKVSVVEFLDKLDEKQMNSYRQNKPEFVLKMQWSDQESEQWTVSKHTKKEDRERYYIRINKSSTLFEVDKAFVERFMAHRDYFRNGKPELSIEIENLVSLEFENSEHQHAVLVKNESGQWTLKDDVKGFQFDNSRFENWLTHFSQLEAQVFLNKQQLKGMNKPSMTLKFRLKDKKDLVVYQFGDTFSSNKTFARMNPLVYTNRDGKGFYGVQKESLKALTFDNLLKKVEMKQSSNEGEPIEN